MRQSGPAVDTSETWFLLKAFPLVRNRDPTTIALLAFQFCNHFSRKAESGTFRKEDQ